MTSDSEPEYVKIKLSAMVEITPTPAELASGKLEIANLERARRAILDEGYVVLVDVVDKDHVARIRDRMLEDVAKILDRPDAPFNFNKGNLQQDPPPFEPYLFKDVLLNDLVIQVTHSILGNGLYNAFYSGNTALANSSGRQPVHADYGHLWPNMEVPTPPYALVVNLPMVDMGAFNGATEIWPGTHKDTFCAIQTGDIKITEEQLEHWRAIHPPIQPDIEAGSVLIRDMRLWHAGMPNPSGQHRPMVAMIHWVSWWPRNEKVKFPSSAKAFFEHPVLDTAIEWVEEEIDHTKHGHSFDLMEAPR
jgi:ectoine hydroxylase-related dioxygenase (phytanoyl-CoA dioxygenase family)